VRVRILMADYATIDQAGKLNITGGGISVVVKPPGPQPVPIALVVSLAVPPELYNSESDLKVALENSSGEPVTMATHEGQQPVRIEHRAKFGEPLVDIPEPGLKRFLWATTQVVVQLPGGVPVQAYAGYQWRVTVDGHTSDDWTERFVALPPPPSPRNPEPTS
jgi:hypothetical protein